MKNENFVQIMKGIKETLSLQKPILNIDEAAFYMGIKKTYLYRLTSSRRIKYYRSKGGKLIYFKKLELEAWMTSNPCEALDT